MNVSLPNEWQLLKIADVAQVNPRRPSELLKLPSDYKVSFVPMPSVCEHQGAITEPIEKSFAEVKKGFTYFAENDVLFAKITPCMQNGKAAIARGLINGLGFGSTEFHVLRAGDNVIPEWLYYFVRQRSFRDEAQANFRGSAGQQRVPADFLSEHLIPVPNPDEQRLIVNRIKEFLSRVDEIKRLRQESRKDAESIFSSVLATVFDELKDGCESSTIDAVTAESRYGTSQKCHTKPEGVAILRIPNIAKGHINTTDLKYCNVNETELRKLLLHNGDILIVRTNGSPDLVGRCAVVELDDGESFGFASYLIRIRVDKERIHPKFLSYFLTSSHGRAAIAKIKRTAAGQYNINSENIRAITFPLPCIEKQSALVEKMDAQRVACEQLVSEQIELSKDENYLTQSILSKAFAGEL